MTENHELPEVCITDILSRTTPVDACRLSLVSKTFQSAADSDDVWNRFIPSNSNLISSIISHSPSLAKASSKKALYLALSDPHKPIIVDEGHKSFQLDRKSGKKCSMLGARALTFFFWSDPLIYWNWTAMPDSRFPEVAEILGVSWLDINGKITHNTLHIFGKINTLALSPNTQYAAYLVFKMIGAWEFRNLPVELSVGVKDGYRSTKIVCLDPNPNVVGRQPRRHRILKFQLPSVRSDGWMEIEMGEFFNSGLEDDEVLMELRVMEMGGKNLRSGLVVEGIEVRVKEDN